MKPRNLEDEEGGIKRKKEEKHQGNISSLFPSPLHSTTPPPPPLLPSFLAEPDRNTTPWGGVGTPPRGGLGGVLAWGMLGDAFESFSSLKTYQTTLDSQEIFKSIFEQVFKNSSRLNFDFKLF